MEMEDYIHRPEVMLLTYTQEPTKTVAAAAKLCYSNADPMTIFDGLDDNSANKFIDMLSGFGHASPFEHANFTFVLNNFSRVTLAQLTRHRIASYSIRSQRYVDNKKNFKPVVPEAIFDNDEAFMIYDETLDKIAESYTKMERILGLQYMNINLKKFEVQSEANAKDVKDLGKFFGIDPDITGDALIAAICEEGFGDIQFTDPEKKNDPLFKMIRGMATAARRKAGEDCRYIYPNGANTAGIITMNARELNNFFNLRCCNRAQWEIRDIAWKMHDEVMQVAPALFKKSGPSCLHGKCSEGKMTCGNPYKEEK